jgi:hypothetical protein
MLVAMLLGLDTDFIYHLPRLTYQTKAHFLDNSSGLLYMRLPFCRTEIRINILICTHCWQVNEEASEKVMEVEQKYSEIRRPVYVRRGDIIKTIPDFWLTAVCMPMYNFPCFMLFFAVLIYCVLCCVPYSFSAILCLASF